MEARSAAIAAADRGGGDRIGCSWKSATAGMVADCVALCCCPCAVVNLLTLALVKAPWKLGRRCFGRGRRRRKERGGSVLLERKGTSAMEIPAEIGGGGTGIDGGEGLEAEKVWFELYQFGHLGFGRVSFTGIQSQSMQGKGN